MKKKRLLLGIVTISLILMGIIAFTFMAKQNVRADSGIPDTEDSTLVQETIVRSYKIEAETAMTFNTAAFVSVFVNDARGGKLIPEQLKFMQDITHNPSKTDFGYLDYKIAYYTWWGKGAETVEQLQTKTAIEGRNPTQEEMQSLVDPTGRIAPYRSTNTKTPEIEFKSITIKGDQAIATFDDGPRINEMTLVKINSGWLIAGNKILAYHI